MASEYGCISFIGDSPIVEEVVTAVVAKMPGVNQEALFRQHLIVDTTGTRNRVAWADGTPYVELLAEQADRELLLYRVAVAFAHVVLGQYRPDDNTDESDRDEQVRQLLSEWDLLD